MTPSQVSVTRSKPRFTVPSMKNPSRRSLAHVAKRKKKYGSIDPQAGADNDYVKSSSRFLTFGISIMGVLVAASLCLLGTLMIGYGTCSSTPVADMAASCAESPFWGLVGGGAVNNTNKLPPVPVVSHAKAPSENWGKLEPPYPTGAWWLNLVLTPKRAVAPLPYTVVIDNGSVQICYPMKKGLISYKTKEILQTFSAQFAVTDQSALPSGENRELEITDYDELSVTVRVPTPSGKVSTHLTRGSPYISVKFDGGTPALWSYNPIRSMERGDFHTKVTFKTGETFVVYSEPKINWAVASRGKTGVRSQILGSSNFHGWIRVAIVPPVHPSPLPVLDRHYRVIPLSGSVNYTSDPNSDSAYLDYSFKTVTLKGNAAFPSNVEPELLLLAASHHAERMNLSQARLELALYRNVPFSRTPAMMNNLKIVKNMTKVDRQDEQAIALGESSIDGAYHCMKGALMGVTGDSWRLHVELPQARWNGERSIPSHLRDYITQAVKRDIYSLTDSFDIYNFTKQAARLARVAVIADELGQTQYRDHALSSLYDAVTPWLNGSKTDNHLVYDKTWGGIITSAGQINPSTDFGNGWYNDHHFQFGYLIYAAAVLIKYDTGDFLENYGDTIRAVAADYANPFKEDEFGHSSVFPVARHKDFWDFHSWASGLFVMDDSKSQESSSEAVNAYYAVALLGDAVKSPQLKQWGRLLMAMEVLGARKYWHMPSWEEVYPEPFGKHKMVGMVSATRAAYFTWFGDLPEYIHCINMMPYTPATPALLPASYVRQEAGILKSSLTRADPPILPAWESLVYMGLAIIDPVTAWNKFLQVKEFDNGLSMTNALWWAATRAGGAAIPEPEEKLNPEAWQCQGAPVCAFDFHGTAWSCCSIPGGCCSTNPIPCCSGIRSGQPPPTPKPTPIPTMNPSDPGAISPPNPTDPNAAPPPAAPPAPPAQPAPPAPGATSPANPAAVPPAAPPAPPAAGPAPPAVSTPPAADPNVASSPAPPPPAPAVVGGQPPSL